jgi:hypothetical protein
MPRVCERRRHERTLLTCPANLLDKAGRLLFSGRAVDIAPGGIRVIGEGGPDLHEGAEVWVALTVPSVRRAGPPTRVVKLRGAIRRINEMGEWKSVIVVIFENDFSDRLLDPML